MKKVSIFILCIYLVLSLIITACLLSYNKYNIAEMSNKVIVTSNKINEKGGNLIFIDKSNNYKVGDEVYYYDSYSSSVRVDKSKIVLIEPVTETEDTLALENNKYISSQYVIGKDIKMIPILGYVYDLVTSRIGYLLFIILPVFVLLLYSITRIVKIIKVKNNEK